MLLYSDHAAYFAPLQQLYDFVCQQPSTTFLEHCTQAKRYFAEQGLDLYSPLFRRFCWAP
jgi:hypothetical protein